MELDKYGPVPARNYDYVVCSNCGAEFQPQVTRCIDCGASTVPPGTATSEVRRHTLSRDAEVVSLRIDEDLEWLEDLQKRFASHGIASRIEPIEGTSSRHPRHEICVAEKDARRAYELDQKVLRERLGNEAAGLAEIPPPGVCPVCKARLPIGAVECRGCGLVLADPDAELDEDDEDFPRLSNLEVVQSFYDGLRDGDEKLILGILHPDVEWIQNEGFPGGGSYTGAETVLDEVFARLGEEWQDWQAAVGRWLNAGDSVVALGAYRGTFRQTGKPVQAAFAHVYWLEKGRIVRFEQYADTAKIAEACAGG
ncbi:MAG TPA: nuclear transport factor 2 family protein [Thermoanaerobaculia bacterium]|nr:nuclear transport factor 2 family protein [Thermoanaerobaculia bacterium]